MRCSFRLYVLLLLTLALLPSPGISEAPSTRGIAPAPASPAPVFDATALGDQVPLDHGWLFHPGDDPAFSSPTLDDRAWLPLDLGRSLPSYGFTGLPYGWYRLHLHLRPGTPDVAFATTRTLGRYQLFANGRLITTVGNLRHHTLYDIAYITPYPVTPTPSGDLIIALRVSFQRATYTGAVPESLFALGAPLLGTTQTLAALGITRTVLDASPFLLNAAPAFITALVALALFSPFARIASTSSSPSTLSPWPSSRSNSSGAGSPPTTSRSSSSKTPSPPSSPSPSSSSSEKLSTSAAPAGCSSSKPSSSSSMPSNCPGPPDTFPTRPPPLPVSPRASYSLSPSPCSSAPLARKTPMRAFCFQASPSSAQRTSTALPRAPSPLSTSAPTSPRTSTSAPSGSSSAPSPTSPRALPPRLPHHPHRPHRPRSQPRRRRARSRPLRSAGPRPRAHRPNARPHHPHRLPPAQEVGGDFFQILPLPCGATLVVIGDVAGKGMPAALTVSLLVGTLRTLAEFTSSPADILAHLNRHLHGRGRGFTTCLALRIDPRTPTTPAQLTLANAGHLPPYRNGHELPTQPSLPLGLIPEATYPETTLPLHPGDHLTLLTDGVPEATQHRQLFGFDRTLALSPEPAQTIAEAARSFGQTDDITVLTFDLEPALQPAVLR